jgi:hypothetical protein
VNMDSGAVVAVTLHGGVAGDTSTIKKTLDAADKNLKKARKLGDETKTGENVEPSRHACSSSGPAAYPRPVSRVGPSLGHPSWSR